MDSTPIRALIVEDDAAWQQILSEIMGDAGLAVDVAASLEAARASLKAAPHRLAVVDLSLGGGDYANQDGLRVLDFVRRLDPGCVTVLLTGYATVELAVNVLTEHGAFTCLRKETFNRAGFRALVQRALASTPASVTTLSPETPAGEETPAEAPSQGLALVVEDDAGWRNILAELLADAGYEVRLCASYGEALGRLRREKFALAVVDLSLAPDPRPFDFAQGKPRPLSLEERGEEMDGYRLLASTRAGGTPTIVVSGVATPDAIERAYAEQGIFAFVEKQAFDRRVFLRTVEEARAAAGNRSELDVLSRRERGVLELLAQGLTNKEIAETLFIAQNTVKRHLKSIFEKLGVHTRSAAAAKAVSGGVEVEWDGGGEEKSD